MRDDFYNNKYIYDKDKILNNYIKDINYKINIYNDYYNQTSFSSLFGKRSKRIYQVPSDFNVPLDETDTSVQMPQGKSYNMDERWSPSSLAGKVYEWDRGVIGVSPSGQVEKQRIDFTGDHHADATVRIAGLLGSPIEETQAPFEAAINCTNQGLLIFQSEGNKAFIYFPETISQAQLLELIKIVRPRNGFEFAFTHHEEVFESEPGQPAINAQTVINFASKLCNVDEKISLGSR